MSKNKHRKPGTVVGQGAELEPVVEETTDLVFEDVSDAAFRSGELGRVVREEITIDASEVGDLGAVLKIDPFDTPAPTVVPENSGPSAVVQKVKTVITTTPTPEVVVAPGVCSNCGNRHVCELPGTIVSCINCSHTIRLV